MARARTESAQQIAELLRTAREALGLSLAFMTRMDETTQHLEVVESAMPLLFRDGTTRPRANSFCQSIMDGKLPAVIPDVGAGFSSLRHIVLTQPDVIKLDRSIVAGVDADPVLRVLARSLVDLAAACGAAVVAEGWRPRPTRSRLPASVCTMVRAGSSGAPVPRRRCGPVTS